MEPAMTCGLCGSPMHVGQTRHRTHAVAPSTAHDAHTITRDCPIDCLKAVLSLKAFNPLTHAYRVSFELPRTVGDVAELYQCRKLGEFWGLGPRRIGEIEPALVFAGLISAHSHSEAGGYDRDQS
jgi:hypothetical protein